MGLYPHLINQCMDSCFVDKVITSESTHGLVMLTNGV